MTPTLIRFSDLKKRGIVGNWPTLLRWIETEGFPPGIQLGPNSRAWPEAEVAEWLNDKRIDGNKTGSKRRQPLTAHNSNRGNLSNADTTARGSNPQG